MSSVPDPIAHAARALASRRLTELFDRDPTRVPRLTFAWNDWRADLAKERITPEAMALLVAHAEACNLPHWISALFAGERINLSEARPALHTALRQQDDAPVAVDGRDVIPDIRATQARMRTLADTLRAHRRLGASGQPIRTVVNLGIGGSDLGPRLVCDALPPASGAAPIDVAFVANVDPAALARTLAPLDPATTLFVVTSKTFTTQETLANAAAARAWLARRLPATGAHFVAVTANVRAAQAFGVHAEDTLPLWDWVGGRYSLWSAVGLPIAIRHGYDAFAALLAGAAAMDTHFRTAPLAQSLPVVLGLLGWWNACVLGHAQRIVVPYAHALAHLPAFLQQLSLESNGKRVTRDGAALAGVTAPGLWGNTGTDSQHAFFQWLHQGTHDVPVEFVVPVRAQQPLRNQQALLVGNALAQAQALLVGRGGDALRAELGAAGLAGPAQDAAFAARECPGNRASTTLLLPTLDAHHCGALLALYEHRTFVESVLMGINAFDQWGVELGKTLARPIIAALEDGAAEGSPGDASTQALIAHARALAARG